MMKKQYPIPSTQIGEILGCQDYTESRLFTCTRFVLSNHHGIKDIVSIHTQAAVGGQRPFVTVSRQLVRNHTVHTLGFALVFCNPEEADWTSLLLEAGTLYHWEKAIMEQVYEVLGYPTQTL